MESIFRKFRPVFSTEKDRSFTSTDFHFTMENSVFYYKMTTFLESTRNGCWPSKSEEYDLRSVIGLGGTALVYEAYCKPRKERCAIKQINIQYPKAKLNALRELIIMKTCNHENIAKFYTSFIVDEELWVVTSLSEGGSLSDIIRYKMTDFEDEVLDEETVATVLKEVLKGLEYLHNNQIIHRDIKAANILVNRNGSVEIADFGLSATPPTILRTSQLKPFRLLVGTPNWMAPEVIENKSGYDFKADIWSFGIMALEIITGDVPCYAPHPYEIIKGALENSRVIIDSNCIDKSRYYNEYRKLINVIACCLQKDPARRPTATELLEHPFFKKAKDKECLVKKLLIWAPQLRFDKSFINAQLQHPQCITYQRESVPALIKLKPFSSNEKETFVTCLDRNNTNLKSEETDLNMERYQKNSISQEYYMCETVSNAMLSNANSAT